MYSYLGNFFSSWVNQTAEESNANDPVWCMAAVDVGTCDRRVEIPSDTCREM